jgi:osmotically-inducible protein OsmY
MKTGVFLISLVIPVMATAVFVGDVRLGIANAASSESAPGSSERKTDKLPTASDQTENEADRKITQQIREAVVKDDALSTSAKNVTIVTIDGKVTLRGAVKNQSEKQKIADRAKKVAGVKNIDNQIAVKQ